MRTVANDYTVRFENRSYQLDQPIYPGERGGKVVIEVRLDGSMSARFGEHHLKYHEITPGGVGSARSEKADPHDISISTNHRTFRLRSNTTSCLW
jgi:hypothetical protein